MDAWKFGGGGRGENDGRARGWSEGRAGLDPQSEARLGALRAGTAFAAAARSAGAAGFAGVERKTSFSMTSRMQAKGRGRYQSRAHVC